MFVPVLIYTSSNKYIFKMKFWDFCCLFFFIFTDQLIPKCSAVLPPFRLTGNLERNDIIEHYFSLGISYSEILMFLGCLHGMYLSMHSTAEENPEEPGLRKNT